VFKGLMLDGAHAICHFMLMLMLMLTLLGSLPGASAVANRGDSRHLNHHQLGESARHPWTVKQLTWC
jgi:hypothetical protein